MLRLPALVMALTVIWGSTAQAGVSYFLVAERPGAVEHGDSFVVGLTDDQHIAHARDLIARGPEEAGAPILFAHIAPGADGINRDLLSPDQRQWNWHIDSVEGFGDMGIELVDGWPTFVEQDVQGWIDNTQGNIGFWSYTIVQELPGYPAVVPPATAVPLPAGVWGGLALMGMIGARGWWSRRAAA